MLDINFIRKNYKIVEDSIKVKNINISLSEIIDLDNKRKEIQTRLDKLRHERQVKSDLLYEAKKRGEDTSNLFSELKELSERIKNEEAIERNVKLELQEKLNWVPNIILPDVPEETSEEVGGTVEYTFGSRREFTFQPKDHIDICSHLGLIDFERGAKIAGSGFPLYTNLGAKLVRGLINFMLTIHTEENGYVEVFPPFLVTPACMFGTGQLPKLHQDMYFLPEDKLYLNPTAEVPTTNIFGGEILNYTDLPIKLVAYTACFRREAGAAGRETRGITRVHQFDKVELVKFVHPDNSEAELQKLVKDAEKILQFLELEYRVVKVAKTELSFASAKTYDLEAYAPGSKRFLEVSSCSNFLDFQARRMNIRFRDTDGKVKFVHTLNGSGVAIPRTLIALLESHQQADGTVKLPDKLAKFLGIDLLTQRNKYLPSKLKLN